LNYLKINCAIILSRINTLNQVNFSKYYEDMINLPCTSLQNNFINFIFSLLNCLSFFQPTMYAPLYLLFKYNNCINLLYKKIPFNYFDYIYITDNNYYLSFKYIESIHIYF